MPTVTLSLRSQRKKPVPDKVQFVNVRGRSSGQVQASDIEIRSDEIVLDLVPDSYTVDVEVNGFKAARGTMTVGREAMARVFPLENRVTTLPTVSQFSAEQRRLLQTLDSMKTPAEIWAALTDNKAATFFQVSHALGAIPQADGSPLSSLVDRIVRVGGAELDGARYGRRVEDRRRLAHARRLRRRRRHRSLTRERRIRPRSE